MFCPLRKTETATKKKKRVFRHTQIYFLYDDHHGGNIFIFAQKVNCLYVGITFHFICALMENVCERKMAKNSTRFHFHQSTLKRLLI